MPMTMAQALVAEFAQEAQATRKMLERVPGDKLDWQPHEKSMTLGRLASHIADLPEWVTTITGKDETDIGGDYEPWIAASTEELVKKFDQCVASFKETLGDLSDQALLQSWTLRNALCAAASSRCPLSPGSSSLIATSELSEADANQRRPWNRLRHSHPVAARRVCRSGAACVS